MKRASIQEVARRAGVSHSTVSRALAGDPRISQTTAERVRMIAAELAYQPNRLARGLKRGQSPLIGILNISTTQSFYGLVIREFETRARAEGIASVVCDTGLDDAAELEALEFLLEFPVRGVLVVGDRRRAAPANDVLARVWRSGMSVAAISGGVPGTDIPRVTVDNERVGYLATRHLLDGGTIVSATLPPACPTTTVRRDSSRADTRGIGRRYVRPGSHPILCSWQGPPPWIAPGSVRSSSA